MDDATFYDENRIAILPTGLCYPGRAPKGGDLPPRPECAPLWHPPVLALMPAIRLTLLVGSYAQAFVLKETRWRTTAWEKAHPWFTHDLLPALRAQVRAVLERD